MYEKFVEVNVLHLFQAAYLLLLNAHEEKCSL